MKLSDVERMPLIKFNYKKPNNCKTPLVKVLDPNYLGKKDQTTYGKRKDVLGFNVKYTVERRKEIKKLDELAEFAEMAGLDNRETYYRIKEFNPNIIKHIRRYNKKKMSKPKIKEGFFWKNVEL